jgi:hypothetical protein
MDKKNNIIKDQSSFAIIVPFFNPCNAKSLQYNANACLSKLAEHTLFDPQTKIFFVELLYIGNAALWTQNQHNLILKIPPGVVHQKVFTESIYFAKEVLCNYCLKIFVHSKLVSK